MANWLMKGHRKKDHDGGEPVHEDRSKDTWEQKKLLIESKANKTRFDRFRGRFMNFLDHLMPFRKGIVVGYSVIIVGLALLLLLTIGRDVLPRVESGQFQVRLRGVEGTRVEHRGDAHQVTATARRYRGQGEHIRYIGIHRSASNVVFYQSHLSLHGRSA